MNWKLLLETTLVAILLLASANLTVSRIMAPLPTSPTRMELLRANNLTGATVAATVIYLVLFFNLIARIFAG